MGWGNPKIVDWKEIEQNINSMVMPTHFIGVYDDFPELQLMYRGDIVIIKDRTYMYTGKEWEELVSIQIIEFGSQGLLDTESQFWTFPPPSRLLLPAAVALGFPEYKLLLSFSLTCSPSWENLGQPLTIPSLYHICKWK